MILAIFRCNILLLCYSIVASGVEEAAISLHYIMSALGSNHILACIIQYTLYIQLGIQNNTWNVSRAACIHIVLCKIYLKKASDRFGSKHFLYWIIYILFPVAHVPKASSFEDFYKTKMFKSSWFDTYHKGFCGKKS